MYTLVNGTHYNVEKYDCYLGPTGTTYEESIKWDRFWADPFYRNHPTEKKPIWTESLLIEIINQRYGRVYEWEEVLKNLENYRPVTYPIICRLLESENKLLLITHLLAQFINDESVLDKIYSHDRLGRYKADKELYEANSLLMLEYLAQKLQLESSLLATVVFIPTMMQQGIKIENGYQLIPITLQDPLLKETTDNDYFCNVSNLGVWEPSSGRLTYDFDTAVDKKTYRGGIYYYQPFEFTWPEN